MKIANTRKGFQHKTVPALVYANDTLCYEARRRMVAGGMGEAS